MTVAYACDCMYMCVNIGDEIFFKGGENVQPEEKFNFSEKG